MHISVFSLLTLTCHLWFQEPCDFSWFQPHEFLADVAQDIGLNTTAVGELFLKESKVEGMYSDADISHDMLDFEGLTHPLEIYNPPEGQVHVCQLCTADNDVYVWWTYEEPKPLYGNCESVKDLQAMDLDHNVTEWALGFAIMPGGCHSVLLNLFKLNGTSVAVPRTLTERFGQGFWLLEEVSWSRDRMNISQKADNNTGPLMTNNNQDDVIHNNFIK